MSSQVNPNVFPDDEKVDKADLREQFAIIKEEISKLQQKNSFANRMAFNDEDFDSL